MEKNDLGDNELRQLQESLLENPKAGNVISGIKWLLILMLPYSK